MGRDLIAFIVRACSKETGSPAEPGVEMVGEKGRAYEASGLSLVALPPVIGVYLLIGALPRLRASAHVTAAKAVVLLLIAAFSAYPIDKFIS